MVRTTTKQGATLAALSIVALALTVEPSPARGQDASADEAPPPEDARTLFQRGQAAYSQGDYESAIAQWTRAFELDPRPLLQFNLSQAYERLGQLEGAIAALERYLEVADPSDEHQADARARLASLRERLGRTSIRVIGGPENATILVDDEDRGRTPRPDPIPVSPGSHRVVVRAAGYEDFVSTVAVPAGQALDVTVETRTAAVSSGGDVPIVPIILFSAGGAALIAGAVIGGIALSDAQAAPGRMTPEADAARGLALAADITMGIGVAAAAAGLIVLLVDSGSGSDSPATDGGSTARVSLAPWATPTAAGLGAAGHF